jgi:hypothetical protein
MTDIVHKVTLLVLPFIDIPRLTLNFRSGVTAYSLHPGVLKTGLQGSDPSLFGRMTGIGMALQPKMSTLEGALNSLYCATSPEAPHTAAGKYCVPVGKVHEKADKFLDDRKGNSELWNISEDALRRLQ